MFNIIAFVWVAQEKEIESGPLDTSRLPSCKKMVQVSHLSMELFYCRFCTGTVCILNKGTALITERTNNKQTNITIKECMLKYVNEGTCKLNK